jgi:hypothetical protein
VAPSLAEAGLFAAADADAAAFAPFEPFAHAASVSAARTTERILM